MINFLLPLLIFSTIFERLNIFIPSLDFSLKISLILLPITGLVLLLKKRLTPNPTFLFPALAAVVSTEILSIALSFDRFQSFQVVILHLLMIGLFYLIIWSGRSEGGLVRLVWAWGIGAATVALLGIWQFFHYALGGDPTLFFERWFSAKTLPADTFLQSLYGLISWRARWDIGMLDHFLRPPSTFIDVTTGASFVGIFLILGLGWFLSWKREDLRRVLMGVLLAVSSLYFLMAVSRSAALGLLVGMGLFAYLYLKELINPWFLKAAIATAATAVLGLGFFFTTTNRLGSTLNRLIYVQDAWQMFIKNPLFGVGVGNFEPYCRTVLNPGSPACYSHSIFLTWLGEMGIVGLAANLFLVATLIYFLYRLFDRLKRENVWKWRIAGLLAAYVALLFANIFHAHYGLEFTWVLTGLAVSGYYLAKRSSELNPEGLESPTLRVDVLGIKVHNVTMAEAVERVKGFFASGRQAYVVTSNSEMVIAGRRDKEFTQILNQADLAVPDTVGLVWASRIWGTPLKERVAGTDLLPRLCEEAARRGGRVLLLEGPEGLRSASAAAEELRRRYPKIDVEALVIGADQDDQAVVAIRNISRGRDFDLLFVAYGHGKQERWISRNLKRIPVKVAMGVGGALDFIAGKQIRAPKMMRSL
ncbi:MAG TPA: WecB/TagA/CpsF family glycosyltransferase, partial [Patescibacteria group bacterium]|nr:WecB/TagA/CpsF family glycosyltransferase [Patescibacteria group bacterium]